MIKPFVSGILERDPIMAILYANFDESGKKGDDSKVVAFAGMCATERTHAPEEV